MEKIYVSPSAKKGVGYLSQYFYNIKKQLATYYEVLESDNRPCLMQGTALLRNSLKADIFLISFIETIGFQKLAYLQYLMAKLSIWIMRVRGKKIIYIFHNIKPHKGENFITRSLTKTMLKRSFLILSHSKPAVEYAEKMLVELNSDSEKVHYFCHPINQLEAKPYQGKVEDCDIFIWGAILPYKGIYEFVSDPRLAKSGLRVHIIGSCKDKGLSEKISNCANEQMVFENRKAEFDEIGWYCKHSRFVLFPYLPGSISSSGALMDTIALGGNPLGPDVGAFSDLKDEGVCNVYKDAEEMFEILKSGTATINEQARKDFIKRDSWEEFARKFHSLCSFSS
jgi:beta-1,4-mannosyltransferase